MAKTNHGTNGDGCFFHEMRESGPSDPTRPDAAWMQMEVASLTGILASPFKTPYPRQKSGSGTAPGLAGELRGYYRRSDKSDRWKPSWSNFGHPRSGNTHYGVDIYAPVGTEIVAIADGYAMLYPDPRPGDDLGSKLGITFTGSDGVKYDVLYGHLSALTGASRPVKKGDILGKTGCSGNAEDGTCATAVNTCGGNSSHLHVAVRRSASGAQYIDPLALFNWNLGYAQDARDVPCSEAFAS
jgi:murein DD-endopeptidase MepM/ murein hydrolase activator NlpD